MKNKRWVYVYLNGEDNYADAKYTAWPLLRVQREFKKRYQNWTQIEVREGDDSETVVSFKGVNGTEWIDNGERCEFCGEAPHVYFCLKDPKHQLA